MKWLEVNCSNPLKGVIKVPGSKNSSLGLLAACCLADGTVNLENIPNIADIRVVCDILRKIGAVVTTENNILYINASKIHTSVIDIEKSSSFRTAYYFVGALLAKHKRVLVGYPGGDSLGSRPIDQHIKGFKSLGAKFTFFNDYYVVEADSLTGTDIYFDVITCGATINIMLAAVLAKGRTVLHNSARDPEVVDIAILLNRMGAKIFGAGTDTIRIEGVDQLGGCSHSVIPDRLIAGSFLMAAGITKGEITVRDIIPEHLESCMEKLAEAGMAIEKKDSSITVSGADPLKAIRVKTGMYPVFSTDYQQPLTSLLLRAKGKSTISEKVYPERFNHCDQLRRMGAEIEIKNGTAYINGSTTLSGNWVHASDIRAGTSLILAGLAAEGTTYITGVEHIERGYEDIVAAFGTLGADVKQRQSDDMNRVMSKTCLLKSVVKKY